MGRHHDRKYGASPIAATSGRYGRYGMKPGMGGAGGLAALVPLLGLGVVAAIIFSIFRRKRLGGLALGSGLATGGIAAANCGVAVQQTCAVQPTCAVQQNCATVGLNEKLVAAERLPGVKYREVDVITRKRVSNITVSKY
jgi:hypothetical protein